MHYQGFYYSLLAALALTASADNWPEWRGPTRDGVTRETNLPLKWTATENVKWKTPLREPGNSTPIVWGDKVFITQPHEAESKRMLLCFDRQTGKLIWEKGVVHGEKEKTHETNPQNSPSPATDGERVIAWYGSAGLVAYDMQGNELWKRDLGKQTHNWGYASSPVIHKDLCYLHFGPGPRTFMIAVNKKTGQTIWQKDYEEKQPEKRLDGFAGKKDGYLGSWSTPIIVTANGREELVNTIPEWIVSYDPATGQELWRCGGLNPLVYTSPVYGEGVVIAMGGFQGPTVAVKTGGNGDVTATHKLFESGRNENRIGSCVIKDGRAYVLTMPGIVECLDLRSGKMLWRERARGEGAKSESWSSMVLSGDKIYVLNKSSETLVLRAGPEFQILQINPLEGEDTNSSIAVSNGEFFIRTHKNLYCISGTTRTASR